jgi:hypothetical protein
MEQIIYDHILIIVSESDINSEKSFLLVPTPTPKNIFSRFQFQLRRSRNRVSEGSAVLYL